MLIKHVRERERALQVQLGDDDARTARGLAVLADMETRLAALGEISKPVHVLKFLNNLEYKAVGGAIPFVV